jgi:hypothetical protein
MPHYRNKFFDLYRSNGERVRAVAMSPKIDTSHLGGTGHTYGVPQCMILDTQQHLTPDGEDAFKIVETDEILTRTPPLKQ